MAKLIGTAPNQVPTNADLGSLAYMDKDNFDANISELTLGALSTQIYDTAVDIFVYDTRKDSDGGAWRKRTQHTSWYNETLNTATRGSRKEFPAVAVIVLENAPSTNDDVIKIYDGDDPDLPMWMVFRMSSASGGADQTTVSAYYASGPYTSSAIYAKNGVIVDCQFRSAGHINGIVKGVTEYKLLEDASYMTTDEGRFKRNGNLGDERNSARSYSLVEGMGIVHTQCNDVAMTVLPNAPIDAATGLPVPTIAVGTDAGASVITDSGSVCDISSTADGNQVSFDSDNKLWIMWGDASGDAIYAYPVSAYTSGDFTNADGVFRFNDGGWSSGKQGNSFDFDHLAVLSNNYIAFGGNYSPADYEGLNIHNDVAYPGAGTELEPEALHANIQSDFNTGWMSGDIKLATLSDTDDTDVTGSELVTNGDFSSGTTGWNAFNAVISVSSGQMTVDDTANAGSNSSAISNGISLSAGVYTISVEVISTTDSAYIAFTTNNTGTPLGSWNVAANQPAGVYSKTITVTGTSTYYVWLCTNGTSVTVFDNVSVRLAEEDRSVNGNGLQVFGSITKNPVATGADLVAYSGFSTSNYLEQPVNTDLQFGTNDWAYMGWFKTTQTNVEVFYFYGQYTTGWVGNGQHRARLTSGNMNFAVTDDNWATSDSITSSGTYNDGNWHHYVALRRGGGIELYADGVSVGSFTLSNAVGSLSNTGATVRYGLRQDNTTPFEGSLALARISATAPSPEQIKKIYEDEKVLFQDNAQATLYGSSDAVTALAYDDSTNLLHVGTSAGRSVFQGLRRVDNTTTAVGAAISASNGLVADE